MIEVLTEGSTAVEPGVASLDELEEQMTESRRRRLDELVTRLRTVLDVQTKVPVGRPHEEIAREVVSNSRDLVLKVGEGSRGLKERLFGNDDLRLLKTCPCPILLIRSIPAKPYRHPCVCAGFYQDENPGGQRGDRYAINRKIREHAAWLATAQFAELHIIHAWEAYGEQHLRSRVSSLPFDADNYVESEQKSSNELRG